MKRDGQTGDMTLGAMGFKVMGFNEMPFRVKVDRKSGYDFFGTQPLTPLRTNLDRTMQMPHKPVQF